MKRALRSLCAAIVIALPPVQAAEIHGESDVFAAPGVSLAWAILRGADEAGTVVVVRVVTAPETRFVAVSGHDPFTRAQKVIVARTATRGCLEVRIPRAAFADFPRTEWHLFGSEEKPRAVVFYLGVPDTTPEMVDEKRLNTYLDQRTSRPPGAGMCPRA